MISLESDKMTALWPNGSLIFIFYVTFPNNIPNWTPFVEEDFWCHDEMTAFGPNYNVRLTLY